MGNKRGASGRKEAPGPREFRKEDGRLGPVKTYQDVADSEDEFHDNRDEILLEGPNAKRLKRWQQDEDDLEPSDEEILASDVDSDEEAEESDKEDELDPRGASAFTSNKNGVELEEDEDGEGWGSSKRDYYNTDNIETEADALEEEAEAKRLQQKKLQKMSEADFGLDESEWLGEDAEDDEADVITEVLKDVEITPAMGPEERLEIMRARYPEFELLANEFLELQPTLQQFQVEEPELSSTESLLKSPSTLTIKHRALAAYMAALTMYFAILTSPASGVDGHARSLDPAELRDHPVMDSLLECRELWNRAKSIKDIEPVSSSEEESEVEEIPLLASDQPVDIRLSRKSKKERVLAAAAKNEAAKHLAKMQQAEEDLADLADLTSKPQRRKQSNRQVAADDDDHSDFGEEESLDARAAAEKVKKKKSLRFYTSQIVQKANKRVGAGRDAGGDEDLPYRERLKDKQARLNAAAEKRGKMLDSYGRGQDLSNVDLDNESDGSQDAAEADEIRADGDDYYDMVAQTSKAKRASREAQHAAAAAATAEGKLVRVVEDSNGADSKRAIGYVIEKNKGLAPKRKKEVRNPRVKKRMMFEKKQKKLSSVRAVYKGGEERGGYAGERTGIKTGLVKSVKL